MNEPTKLQTKTIKAITKFYLKNMYPPSYEEVGEIFGITKKAVYDRVILMRKKGMFQHKSKLIPVGVKVVKIVDTIFH